MFTRRALKKKGCLPGNRLPVKLCEYKCGSAITSWLEDVLNTHIVSPSLKLYQNHEWYWRELLRKMILCICKEQLIKLPEKNNNWVPIILTSAFILSLLSGSYSHSQWSTIEVVIVKVSHGTLCCFQVLVLTEPITFWFACLSVID